jgi:DNA-binding NarL/FixJ family response regulator
LRINIAYNVAYGVSYKRGSYIQHDRYANMTSHRIRVILADDHAVVRAGIRQFLEHAGDIQVVGEADDGREAQELIFRQRPDVAVLDIQMPNASGIEVTRWIRSKMRQVGILVLTAYDDDPYVTAVLQAGANGYILKTASPAEIIQAVRDVHAGKSALDASITQKLIAQIANQGETSDVESLSQRELEVLTLAAKGYTNKAIARQLNISDRTVQGHLAHIFAKLHAASRTEAVMRAVSLGWIPQNVGEID